MSNSTPAVSSEAVNDTAISNEAALEELEIIAKQRQALEIPLEQVELGQNVRSDLGNISDLKESIQRDGLLEPVIVTPKLEDGKLIKDRYVLIAGFRRHAAARLLKYTAIPAVVVTADERKRVVIALTENLHREEMNALDRARALQRIMELLNLDQRALAQRMGVSDGYVSQHLALLKLPKPVQMAVKKEEIEMAHVRQIVRLKDEEAQLKVLEDATKMTSTQLQAKIEFMVQKEKEKAEKEREKQEAAGTAKKPAAKKRAKSDDEEVEEARQSFAEKRYGNAQLEPLKKTDMRDALYYYAEKYDRAESENKKAEYKFIMMGLEIAAGLRELK